LAYAVYLLANRRHGTLYLGATNNLGRRASISTPASRTDLRHSGSPKANPEPMNATFAQKGDTPLA
jgi:hypothetical protein